MAASALTLRVRPATADDSRDIWLWRNDAHTRAMSRTQDETPWQDHAQWFAKAVADPAVAIFIGEAAGASVGMCRFDRRRDPADCEVSINLNPQFRGQGLSSRLLAKAIAAYSETYVGQFVAEIRHDNLASLRCFAGNGFLRESEGSGFGRYRLTR